MKKILLKMIGITKSFPGVKALNQAGLTVYAGRVMALMGENGAGKSTLMKILTGIYPKDFGNIEYLGESVEFFDPKESQIAGISIIHQELNLVGNLTIAENIFLGREFKTRWGSIDWHRMQSEANKLLDRLGVKHRANTLCSSLSIGEQQMVEIAKALSLESKVIIMDEPTDALTEAESSALFNIIKELKAENRGIVYISHRLPEIFAVCDDVTVLRDGQWIGECAISELSEEQLIEMMVGRKLEEQYPYLEQPRGELLLEVRNLNGRGVKDVSFSLYKGEVVGISGLMGSGRSELMKLLYGALPKTSGQILLKKEEIDIDSPQKGLNSGIAYISEDRKGEGLILGMSVKENMSLASLNNFSQYYCLKHSLEREGVNEFIESFHIKTPSLDKPIGLLSGGNQQKVAIAKGLMVNPDILILDEPTRGVDVGAKKEIYQLINAFKAKGLSILIVSSDMPEILGISDRILVMHEGMMKVEFSRQQATQENLLMAALGK